jgi:dUTP pyrophosphatase
MIDIKITTAKVEAKIPIKTFPDDAGYDLYSCDEVTIKSHAWCLINTGIKVTLPSDVHAEVRPRSGLALKHGVTVLNSPGTIDPGYRGEIQVVLINHGTKPYKVSVGDSVAQLVFMRHCSHNLVEPDVTKETNRGSLGFGSG